MDTRRSMFRIIHLLLLFFVASCQVKSVDGSGELISGNRVVDNHFTVSVPSAGTRLAGDVLTFTLTFPYDVTVSGTPRLTLDIGGVTRYADYLAGDGTKSLTFAYTVQVSDSDSDGIGVSSILDLNGGSLNFTGTNGAASCSTSLTVPSTSLVLVDNSVPVVTLVSAPSNGTYYVNMPLTFMVTMSKPTTVVGTPRLILDIGGVTTYANYLSGSGTTSLLFRYTILSGDLDTNGIAVSPVIDSNGATLKDVLANSATLTFVGPNTAAVLVNGNIPYVTAVTQPANGNYGLGDNLDFVFTYSEAVTVNATPTLSLTVGSTTRLAAYYSGSGTTQLTFRYVVQAGEVDTNGIASGSSFSLSGGAWIRDASANNAVNLFSMPSLLGVLVADNRPTISSFLVNNGTYYIGNTFTFTALFNEAVIVSGTPRIPLTLNTGGPVYATYLSGSGTTNIVFTYTVAEGTDDNNGVVITSPVDLNSGSIKNVNNIEAKLSFTQPSTTSLRVSGIRPEITSVTAPSDGNYTTGQTLSFVANFSEVVTVGNSSNVKLNLTIGATPRQASYSAGSGSTAITFSYTVVGADLDSDGIEVGTIAVTSTGYINDGTSTANTSTLTFTSPATSAILVNSSIPTISSVTSPGDATYIAGQNVDFILNYSEAVNVTGTPRIGLTVGSSTLYASYLSGSGSSALSFRYTVSSGDEDIDGITAATAVDNNGGTILSSLSVSASATIPTQVLSSVLVDGIIPAITGSTKPINNIYTISDTSLTFTVTWNDTVTVVGTPRLALTVGTATGHAIYTSGSGTTTLTFVYTINAADLDLNGIAAASTIDLNSGTINDASGNPASVTVGLQDLSQIYINYSGMLAWWDVDYTAGVSSGVCGAAYCATQIADKNGGATHATASGSARPQYVGSGFGGGNTGYLQFDNISMVMGAASGLNSVRTVFIVFQTEVAAMTTQDLFYESGLAVKVEVSSIGELDLGVVAGHSLNGSALTGSSSSYATAMAANTQYILAVQFATDYNFTTPFLGSTNFGGKIAEVLVYSSTLSASDVAAVVQYLNTKHQVY